MSFKLLIALLLISGVVIATDGFLMVLVGGWGPCGPAGIVADIGGRLLIIAALAWAALLILLPAFLQDRKDSMIPGRPHEKNR